jgi:hypothetical protein
LKSIAARKKLCRGCRAADQSRKDKLNLKSSSQTAIAAQLKIPSLDLKKKAQDSIAKKPKQTQSPVRVELPMEKSAAGEQEAR